MLDELHVRDYALVRDARLVFPPGCTVLSGETGAGKTALVGALKLLIGERGDTSAVRDGATELVVEGRFIIGDEEHIATRRLSREGRSRCSLDDGMATVSTLAATLGPLVDLHGQHEHQSLLAPAVQLASLDRYAGEPARDALEAYQAAWEARDAAAEALDALREASVASEQATEEARQAIRDMEAVRPAPDEYEELEAQLPLLRNSEELARASQAALDALRGAEEGQAGIAAVSVAGQGSGQGLGQGFGHALGQGGVLDALAFAQRALAQQEGVSTRLDELAAQLESLAIMADDLAASFRAYREDVEFDPQALEEALARLAALEGLRKRYGPRMEDVFAAWEQAALRLSLTEDRDERLKAAEGALDEAEEALREAAHELAFVRGRAAEALAEELNLSMRGLAMEGASISFSCQELARSAWTRGASVRYELLYQPSATSSPRPLAKIASGGELSRVMLALKTLLGPAGGAKVLIFDEVDAGIGGAAAIAVADRLRALAESQQVIVVTHLAQIAAIADCQFVVEKSWEDGGSAFTVIREVAGEERVAEIARMLAGATDETALEHARELLASREGARRS